MLTPSASSGRPKRSQIIFHWSFPIKLPHVETRDNDRNFTCFPTCPFVSHGPVIVCVISTLKSRGVPSCRVSCCPATTYGVCLVVPLVSSRRCAMSCFAMSCLSNHNTVEIFRVPPLSWRDLVTHRNQARANGELHLFNSEVSYCNSIMTRSHII